MADRNFLRRRLFFLFGIILTSGVLSSMLAADPNIVEITSTPLTLPPPTNGMTCVTWDENDITDEKEKAVTMRKKGGEVGRFFRSPRQDGGTGSSEVGYKCRSSSVARPAELRNVDSPQYLVEFLRGPLRRKKIYGGSSLFKSGARNASKITKKFSKPARYNIVSCAPFSLLTNDSAGEAGEPEKRLARISDSKNEANSTQTKTIEDVLKKFSGRKVINFRCKGGDTLDHLSAISAVYVSTFQSKSNHRKRSREHRSRPEAHTSTSGRKDSGFKVSCLDMGRAYIESGAHIPNNSGRNRTVSGNPHSPIENGSEVVLRDSTFSCDSRSIRLSIRLKEIEAAHGAPPTSQFVLCPSKRNSYAKKWRKLYSKLSPKKMKHSSSKRKSKYNMKYFKLYREEENIEMVCHIVRKRNRNKKVRRKRSLKGSPPEMMYSFIEQAVQPGGHISLKCSASGDPLPRFDWMLDKQALSLSSSHRYAVGQFMDHAGFVVSHLNISGVRVEDGGLYECKAMNPRGESAHSARLNVYGPPYIRSISVLKGITGGDITILCPYYGYPISYVKWESSRQKITSNPRYKQDGSILKISRLDPSTDAGSYTCSVATPGGELARRELQLLINSPPVLSPLFSLPNLKSGERAQLSCTVTSGDMPIYFSWMKDGLPLSPTLQIDERSAEFFSYLIFKSLASSHSGSYTCIATNSAGKVNTSAELIIKVAPYWHYEPQDLSTLLGSSVFINCDAKGYPEPRTFWSKQHNKLSEDFDTISPISGHLSVFNNGSLFINSILSQDEGNYRCTAENGIGNILYKNIVVDVNEPARFDVSSQNITTRRNDPVTLVCDVLGDNPVQNIWTHNTSPIDTHNYRLSISELKKENGLRSQLSIERADRQDSGLYRCQASNAYGRSEHFIHLAVQERPDPPTRVEVMQVGSRSVRLTWRRPFDGNSPVLGYLLQYQPLGPEARDSWDSASIVNLTIATSSIHSISGEGSDTMEQGEVGGLQPDTTYSMRMLAVNQIESSSFTDTIMAKTHEEAPAEPPQNVHVQPGEAGELIVTWQSPPTNAWHGQLMGFTVHWSESSDPEASSPQIPHTSSATVKGPTSGRFSISGLAQFTRYRVTVSAANRAGNGPPSVPVLATTKEGVPSAPPQSVHCTPLSSQSLKIEWASPPRSHHGGNLLGYKILYKPLSDIYMEESVSAAEVKRTSSSETYLHALLKYTNYSIQVLAYTGAGDGILSPAVFCTTEEDIPGPPANIKAISTTAESILVSWLPPKKPNGNIVFYTLYYREAGRSGQPISRQISLAEAENMNGAGLGGAVEARGLVEKGRYEFWLSASTGAGEGGSTSPVTQVTTARAGARIASFGGTVRSGTGRSLLLGCLSVGNPTPRARWLHSQRTITHSHLYRVTTEGNLLIHSVDQTVSGNYTCSAKNLFGSDDITYTVICLLPPGHPSLQLLYTTASSAQLQWSPNASDGGSPILGYTLSYKRLEESLQIIELSAEVTSYKVDGLKCGSRYSFQITAHNRVGKGDASSSIVVNTKGDAPKFPEDWSDLIWSNSSCIVVEVRRALGGNGGGGLGGEGSLCPLLALGAEWRRGGRKDAGIWRATNVPGSAALLLTSLVPAQWYEIRLSAENHAGRSEATVRAATTTLSGALISPSIDLPMEPMYPNDLDGSQDNIFNLISIILATVAAISTLSVAYLLIMKRHVICHCASESVYGGERQRSQSQASDEKTICAEQQNIRNCQHDYSTSPIKGHTDKMRRESAEMYEISPYATFQVGGPNRPGPAAPTTLDHTLQFRTFGHLENDEPPLQAPCKRHFPQKAHKHTNSKDTERIDSGCELQPLRTKSRSRQFSGPSYCVPMPQQEIYTRESSTESNDMSPPTERARTPRHYTERQLQIHQSHS